MGNDTWVEVIRLFAHYGEGTKWAKACWFNVYKGSGIFLNVGKTAIFDGSHDFVHQEAAKEYPKLRKTLYDSMFWRYAEMKGLDTVQTAYSKDTDAQTPQLLLFGGACSNTEFYKTCPPGFELRTGLNHDLPCNCSDHLRHLNCGR